MPMVWLDAHVLIWFALMEFSPTEPSNKQKMYNTLKNGYS